MFVPYAHNCPGCGEWVQSTHVCKKDVWPKVHPWQMETGIDDYKQEHSIRAEKVMW